MNKRTDIEMIPVDQIKILNPRDRNKRRFKTIVDNISQVGLKRPITVSKAKASGKSHLYDLVCGQGRIEAYRVLDQKKFPPLLSMLRGKTVF